MSERYSTLKTGSLFDYITPDKFRTVPAIQEGLAAPGVSEFPVEFQLKGRMKNMLPFEIPWDGVIYGCARGKKELAEKLGFKSEILSASIVDWDDKFLLIFETADRNDYPALFVYTEDVISLLCNCMRYPGQR